MKFPFVILIFWAFLAAPFSVYAKGVEGCFKANKICDAYQSFRKKTNPGGIQLEAGELYPVIGRNKKKDAFRIIVKGIKRPARWVEGSCGEITQSCNRSKSFVKIDKKNLSKLPQYLLALSWQPSFCKMHSDKKECRTQTNNRYDASHWSLHGLWPQPRGNAYCGVSDMDKGIDRNKRWHLLAPVKLSQKTATDLAFAMPGVASNLHRHEWIKHGTCYGADVETYFSDSINLTGKINNSIVGQFFTKSVGKRVSLKEVRMHFDKAFGKGAGAKVDMRCDRKGRVSELWINLKGKITKKTKIATLLKDSIPAGFSCSIGMVYSAN